MTIFTRTITAYSLILIGLAFHGLSEAEEINKNLHVYGRAHVSFDQAKNDLSTENSVSSNASRFGFKGTREANESLLWEWQIEQTVRLDQTGGSLATRNSFVGLRSSNHRLLMGHHDTPYKLVAGYWGLFSDTVADRLALLGASPIDSFRMNDRGENAVMYQGNYGPLEAQVMYSASNPNRSVNGSVDDNDTKLVSGALYFRRGGWYAGISRENWDAMAITNINTLTVERTEVTGWRAALTYTADKHHIGAVYEDIDPDDRVNFPHWDRDVYGISYKYSISPSYNLATHVLKAEEYYGSIDTDATLFGIGLFYLPGAQSEIYLAYAITRNNVNASYNVADGGHGDILEPATPGDDPRVVSVGLVYNF
ncbi:MAG: porin [Gammaproteobacteria bacterium]|nr:porin [Gammaproteobacteria bacterium]